MAYNNWLAQVTGGPQFNLQGPIGPSKPGYVQGTADRVPGGSVLGAQTTAQPTGGGVPAQPTDIGQPPMETPKPQPEINYDDIYNPAFQALEGQVGAQQSLYGSQVSGAETDASQQQSDLLAQQEETMGELGQRRTEEQSRTESIVDKARRQAAEILQGIQARYGGSTGTGKFTS